MDVMSNLDRRKFYIDGAWVKPIQPNDFAVLNPATGESIATISLGSVEDIDLAVQAARRAFASWSVATPGQRTELLQNILAVYQKRYDEMPLSSAWNWGRRSACRGSHRRPVASATCRRLSALAQICNRSNSWTTVIFCCANRSVSAV